MLHSFSISNTQLTLFVVINWAATLCCASAFAYVYFRQRFLLVKPSLLIAGLAHLMFQWPMAVYAGYYENWLPRPYEISMLVHGFSGGGLIAGILLFRNAAQASWSKIGATITVDDESARVRGIAILSVVAAFLVGLYLSYVPFSCTGLHALARDPAQIALAREISLKLLANNAPKYGLTLLFSSVVPLLTGIVAVEIIFLGMARKSVLRIALYVLLLITLWFGSNMPGAKGIFVNYSLVVAALFVWLKRLQLKPIYIPMLLVLALAPAYSISLLLSMVPADNNTANIESCFTRMDINLGDRGTTGELVTQLGSQQPSAVLTETIEQRVPFTRSSAAEPVKSDGIVDRLLYWPKAAALAAWNKILDLTEKALVLWDRFARIAYNARLQVEAILYRAVVVPFEVGGWYVHHEQMQGPIGIAAIPRLAKLVGVQPVDGPNQIGRAYGPEYYGHEVPATISASAGFAFSYFAYFGKWAILLNVLLLILTDVPLIAYRYIHRAFVLPLAAALIVPMFRFLDSDYTAVWLTHGFGVMVIIALVLTAAIRFWPKLRMRTA